MELGSLLSLSVLGGNVAASGEQSVTNRKTVWEHESKDFRIDELTVETVGAPTIQWATFERGDAVAALIVNTDTNQAILVRQFRPPIAAKEGAGARLIETVAGMVRQNEQPLQSLQREIEEETGYKLAFNSATGGLACTELVGEFYSSPGGTSEKIYLYYVEVDQRTPKGAGGGIKEQGESIETVLMPLEEFFDSLDRRAFKDPKLIIAGHWVARHLANRRRGPTGNKQEFTLKNESDGDRRPARIIGYRVGDIGEVEGVEVWVNSCNTEFMMDSVHHKTLSARIRTLGARNSGGVMIEDKIQRALERRLGIGRGMSIGNVLDTEPGALTSKGVRRLLHVASIQTRIAADGTAVTVTTLPDLEKCLIETLKTCDALNARWLSIDRRWRGPYRSVLLPLFGAGVDRSRPELSPQSVCEALVPAAIKYLQDHPSSSIEKVYFLAYTPLEVEILDSVLSRREELDRIAAASP